MGGKSSKFTDHGTLPGAFAPPLQGISPPPPPKMRKFLVKIPPGAAPGDVIRKSIDGKEVQIQIPTKLSMEEKEEGKFLYTIFTDIDKILASTLPTVPGMEIVQAKPIIWGTSSLAFTAHPQAQNSMAVQVGMLLQEAQREVLQQAMLAGCNAVLNLNFSVTNDSGGADSRNKMVLVTAVGTPCILMPTARPPPVEAQAIVVDFLGDTGYE